MSWVALRDELAGQITPELCAEVRRLRVQEKQSWRGVSHDIFDHPSSAAIARHRDMSGDQPLGQFLCELCAISLGEDPNAEPWNG